MPKSDGQDASGRSRPPADGALSESLEDYLEAIYHIVAEKHAARATDISERLGVNRSSVTGALRSLSRRGMVNYAPYDVVTLTEQGRAAAERVVQRHRVLRDFFVKVLAVPGDVADAAACGMEHHVGELVLRRLGYLGEFLSRSRSRASRRWLGEFVEFCRLRERKAGGRAGPASRASKAAGKKER